MVHFCLESRHDFQIMRIRKSMLVIGVCVHCQELILSRHFRHIGMRIPFRSRCGSVDTYLMHRQRDCPVEIIAVAIVHIPYDPPARKRIQLHIELLDESGVVRLGLPAFDILQGSVIEEVPVRIVYRADRPDIPGEVLERTVCHGCRLMIPFPHVSGAVAYFQELVRGCLHFPENIQPLQAVEVPVQRTFLIDVVGRDIIVHGICSAVYAEVVFLGCSQIAEKDIIAVYIVISFGIGSPPLAVFGRNSIVGYFPVHVVLYSLKTFGADVVSETGIVRSRIEIESP